jgi:GntR family transcriptional regulator/MocR family aminotransferase
VELFVKLEGRDNLSEAIYRDIRRGIVEGRLRLGERLPSSRELARSLRVARMTVVVAYERLAGEGFTASRAGAGTYVNQLVPSSTNARTRHQVAELRPRPIWKSLSLPGLYGLTAPFEFRTGVPDPSLFPYRTWRRLTASVLRSDANGVYGPPAGHRALREAIARHVTVSRGVDAAVDHLTITSGAQQAIDLIGRVWLKPGDRVAVENPGYTPPSRLFESLGACVHGVPVDSEGLVVDALPRGTRLVYVTPSHQNPLGVTMALPRRVALLAWAARHNAVIVEDDYDSEFRFSDRPIEPLQTLDTAGRVLYVGSFSKTLSPALRLGFVVSPPSLSEAMQKAKYVTDYHTSMPAQGVLARFIADGGFARHVRRASRVYRQRHELITRYLTSHFSEHLEVIPSATGLHITAVARRASVERIRAVLRKASDVGVRLHDLSAHSVKPPSRSGIVLGP